MYSYFHFRFLYVVCVLAAALNQNLVVDACRVPNYRLIRPSPQLHLPKLKLISAEALP